MECHAYIEINKPIADEIKQQVDDFKRRGGKIDKIPLGYTKEANGRWIKKDSKK